MSEKDPKITMTLKLKESTRAAPFRNKKMIQPKRIKQQLRDLHTKLALSALVIPN